MKRLYMAAFVGVWLVAILCLLGGCNAASSQSMPFSLDALAGTDPANTHNALAPKVHTSLAPSSVAQADAPPVLVSVAPADGAAWNGDPVSFTFDQPMDAASADALTVTPALDGTTSVQDATITFTPATTPEPGVRYHFTIAERAVSANGAALSAPVEVSLVGAVPLEVTTTQPADGAQEIAPDTQIIVIFNRPVVPLTGVDEQADLPQPLTLEPAVEGEGKWLNTSVYVFQPSRGLAGATEYSATVDGVTGVSGESLASPYHFSFTTAAPIVSTSSPVGINTRPDTGITVEFSQPMDTASTEAAFFIQQTEPADTPVDGAITWNDLHTTLTFTPTAAFEFGASYRYGVGDEAQAASLQGNLRAPYTVNFTVVPLPAVQAVSPINGARDVSPDTTVEIRFNAPVSPTLAANNVTVTPLLTSTQVFSYYSFYDNMLQLSWFKEPNTLYTVTVGSEIADEYGNTLGEDYVFNFTTGDYAPFVRLELDRFTHFSADAGARTSLLYRNMDSVGVDLYTLPLTELMRMTGSNQYQIWENYQIPQPDTNLIWHRDYEAVTDRNVAIRQVITLTDAAGDPLPPGVYFLQVDQPPAQAESDPYSTQAQAVVILSNNNLVLKKSQEGPSLAWLTDLRSAAPLGGRDVEFYSDGELVGSGVTANDGTVTATLTLSPENSWIGVLAVTGVPGERDFSTVSSDWNQGIAIWEFGLNGGYPADQLRAYFYTDRPIYRPGQTVYWKGIVRALVDDQYAIPKNMGPLNVRINDFMGNTIFSDEVTLNDHGTVNGEFHLSPEAVSGFYYIDARFGEETAPFWSGGTGFQVASYRKPEFEISVTSQEPEYLQGDTVRIDVQANYFSGGPLADAPVTWRIIAQPYTFQWEGAPADRFYSFTPIDPDQYEYDPYSSAFATGLIKEGVGRTNADGSFTIELPADISQSLQSQEWYFDVTVQSSTNQYVAGNVTVPIHRAAYYIGLSPRGYVWNAGEEGAVDIVTVTPDGAPYPAAALEVIVYEFAWNSVYVRSADGTYRWDTDVERTPVYTTTAETDEQGMATIGWRPPKGGQYQVAAFGVDEDGNPTNSAAFIWVSAANPGDVVAWPQENNDRIELVADKAKYAPGDTAHILVPSPFTDTVQALVSIERGGVLEHQTMTLHGNSESLDIPITTAHIPNIFVGVVLLKGVDETNPTPAIRVGYVPLTVDTAEKELALDIQPSSDLVAPGTTIAYTVTVVDRAGEPVPAAEVSLALVDKAVLSLASNIDQSLVDVFYYQRPLDVVMGALLVINNDRRSQQLSEGAKGGGGGDGGGLLDLREDFPDIAYWRADALSDADGLIRFSVPLPDNLTTWRLVAKAVTKDTRVGDGVNDIVATKDLQVRPLAPRFFTAGDRATLGAAILNTGESDLSNGEVTFAITGAQIEGNSPVTVPLDLASGAQTVQTWPVAVDSEAAEVVVTITARGEPGADGEELTDAVRLTIPVRRYVSSEIVATSGVVPPAGLTEAIIVPAAATGDGELRVTLNASLAGGMLDGLTYLEHYPYECNEQTVSRFLPNLFTVQAFDKLGISNPDLEKQLSYQLGIAVQRLTSRQNPDGGWGYWPGEESSPFISAYILWGLSTANAEGYTVPAMALDNAVTYLESQFVAPTGEVDTSKLNEMAFTNFVLAEMGEGDPGRASTLYDVRERLDLYAQALLAMALADMQEPGAPDQRVQTLLSDLMGASQLSATGAFWQEGALDLPNLNTNTRTTSMALTAFARLQPDQELLPQVVRWLMSTREMGHWATTQENAWVIMALSTWLETSGELDADYDWQVDLNNSPLGEGHFGADNVNEPVELSASVQDLLLDQANLLAFSRTGEEGTLYYDTYLNYSIDATAVDSRDRGIVVDRRFARHDDPTGAPVSRVAVGDVVSVTVTIVAPTDLYQVLIETPIPAGMEPIDPNLATTSSEFTMPGALEPVDAQPISWFYWQPTYTDVRDDKVALFATFLPAGAYEYTFNARASIPGEYRVLPVYAEQMYFNEVWGRSAGSLFTVTK